MSCLVFWMSWPYSSESPLYIFIWLRFRHLHHHYFLCINHHSTIKQIWNCSLILLFDSKGSVVSISLFSKVTFLTYLLFLIKIFQQRSLFGIYLSFYLLFAVITKLMLESIWIDHVEASSLIWVLDILKN